MRTLERRLSLIMWLDRDRRYPQSLSMCSNIIPCFLLLSILVDYLLGMILLSELSRRRIRSINKLIRVGRTETVVVIRVDKDKGYIDLSKRRVSQEDIERCLEQVSKAKAVNSILRHVASTLGYKTNEELEELYKKTAWRFEAKTKKKGSSYDWFKQVLELIWVL